MPQIIERVAQRTGFPESSVRIMLDNFFYELSWDEIHEYHRELRKGQSVYEDAGGYFIRCIKRLFGYPVDDEEVITYRNALKALVADKNNPQPAKDV